MEFTFTLTEDEANKVVDALGKEPYLNVVTLIGKLNEQAYKQRQKNKE